MAGILPPELKSIEELFTSDKYYHVPKYQRSFAWTSDEVEELWDDIQSAIQRKGDYFLGTIVLHKRDDDKQEIIDGQQRLTCISMMFSSIRNVFLSKNDHSNAAKIFNDFLGYKGYARNDTPIQKLFLNEINNLYYVKYVLESANLDKVNSVLKQKGLDESNKRLLEAYQFFLQKIIAASSEKGTDYEDFIVPLIECLSQSVKIIKIPVTSEEDANLFFESLNARGKELAISDLVKNRLYLEAGNQVSYAQSLWEKMDTELVRRPIPEFLRHYWIAKKVDAKNLLVREKQLYKLVTKDIGSQTKSIELLKDLANSARDYAKITDYSLWPDDPSYDMAFDELINELILFRVTQCNPILLNAIQKFNQTKHIVQIFKIVVNFSFRYFIIGNQSPGNLERESSKIALGIRDGEYSNPSEVANAFRVINPDPTFRSDFSLALMPKSRARIARYTLAKISNYLARQESKAGLEQITNPDAKQVNLEHVLPQNPGSEWKKDFAKDVGIEDYIYRLGNLTLLNSKVNDDAANSSFAEKKRLAFATSKLTINQHFLGLNSWGNSEIDQRQNNMAKIALAIWLL